MQRRHAHPQSRQTAQTAQADHGPVFVLLRVFYKHAERAKLDPMRTAVRRLYEFDQTDARRLHDPKALFETRPDVAAFGHALKLFCRMRLGRARFYTRRLDEFGNARNHRQLF